MAIQRIPEPEVMRDAQEALAYQQGDFRRVNQAFARRLSRHLPADRGRALDLGTGPAEIPILFCALAPSWEVTAVDRSRAMLKLARNNVREAGMLRRIALLEGNAKCLDLERPFDLVFSNSLLHHLPNPAPFWREVKRLVKPRGRVVIMDLRRPANRRRARELVSCHAAKDTPLLRQLFHQSLLAAFTPDEVRRQLEAAGIDGLSVRVTTDRHMVVSGSPS